MKQYPIWNEVVAPDYKNSFGKSFGTRSYTKTTVCIGSSSRNSWEFLTHETRVTDKDNGTRIFEFIIDGDVMMFAIYDPKSKDAPIAKKLFDKPDVADTDRCSTIKDQSHWAALTD